MRTSPKAHFKVIDRPRQNRKSESVGTPLSALFVARESQAVPK